MKDHLGPRIILLGTVARYTDTSNEVKSEVASCSPGGVTSERCVTFEGGVASEGGVTSERHPTTEQREAFGRGVAFEWSGLAAKSKMPRIRYEWENLGEFNSSEAVSEFKSVGFCCSRVVHSDPACGCRVCEGSDHIMTEKRLRCVSRTCKVDGLASICGKSGSAELRSSGMCIITQLITSV
ncbi:hypothetical protein GQ600_23219 [Phytophthora cactorum]|nr:hypothetical protein GQ600_23219 [Phytophthora cactorum]